MSLQGKICRIVGPVIDVYFPFDKKVPAIYNALYLKSEEGRDLTLEVLHHLGQGVVRCLAMDWSQGLKLDQEVFDSGSPIVIPVGQGTVGRLMDALGNPIDNLGPINSAIKRSIHNEPPGFEHQLAPKEILETGIKAIDLLCPFVKGGKNCILGGAGVGKTLLLTELMRNITERYHIYGVFAGIGERIREAYEVWQDLKRSNALERTTLVFGSMSEPPGTRLRTGLAALTIAEYFKETSGQVLLFVDNIARFAQAGSEVSALLGRLPGPMGYSPTLEIDMGQFQERIATMHSGLMTSVQTAYLPADDYSDPVVVATIPHMDAVVELSRELCNMGIFPAVNPLSASSELLRPEIVGEKHFSVANSVQRIMQRYQELQDMLVVFGKEELSREDQVILVRARKLYRFLSQPMAVAEPLTGVKGIYVPLEQTVSDFAEIVDGQHDNLPEQAFYMVGTLEQAKKKAKLLSS